MRSQAYFLAAACALICSAAYACSESDADEVPQTIGGVVLRIGATVELRYGDQPVECGADLTVSKTASKPGIDIGQADAEAKYTLVLVDPDAPGGPFLHYIAADIPGDQRQEHRTVVSYKGSGKHRYVALLLQQRGEFPGNGISNKRANYDLSQFVSDNSLESQVAGYQYFVVKALPTE